MVRVKRGIVSRRKHKKLLGQTKGYRATKSKLVRKAKEASLHAGAYAYHGRKLRKRDFRTLWITRISEAVKQQGLSYSVFMNKLKLSCQFHAGRQAAWQDRYWMGSGIFHPVPFSLPAGRLQ